MEERKSPKEDYKEVSDCRCKRGDQAIVPSHPQSASHPIHIHILPVLNVSAPSNFLSLPYPTRHCFLALQGSIQKTVLSKGPSPWLGPCVTWDTYHRTHSSGSPNPWMFPSARLPSFQVCMLINGQQNTLLQLLVSQFRLNWHQTSLWHWVTMWKWPHCCHIHLCSLWVQDFCKDMAQCTLGCTSEKFLMEKSVNRKKKNLQHSSIIYGPQNAAKLTFLTKNSWESNRELSCVLVVCSHLHLECTRQATTISFHKSF